MTTETQIARKRYLGRTKLGREKAAAAALRSSTAAAPGKGSKKTY